MPATFDRSSDDDAKASADKILEKVADGLMPCDRPRAEDQMALFREWVPPAIRLEAVQTRPDRSFNPEGDDVDRRRDALRS